MFPPQITKRPVKKSSASGNRLGPPDIYPQESKQKEDELSAVTLKQGFIYTPVSTAEAEYGSGRLQNGNALSNTTNLTTFLNSVLSKKEELNLLTDPAKKKPFLPNKENFFSPNTAKTKQLTENFFRDQLNGSRPPHVLEKIPVYARKEELFLDLYHHGQIPYVRATWFIKFSQANSTAQPEQKQRKKHAGDAGTEWTQALLKILKDLLSKLLDHYRMIPTDSMSSMTSSQNLLGGAEDGAKQDYKSLLDQWKYMFGLAAHLLDECLLDRHEFCSWIVETLEKARSSADGGLLKLLIPSIMRFLREIFQSEILTRKLASFCSKYIASVISPNPLKIVKGSGAMKSVEQLTEEALDCPHHGVTLQFSVCILQLIVTHCTTACIWNSIIGERVSSVFDGSPLDTLPVQPSRLPISPSVEREMPDFKMRIKWKEDEIQERSRQVEARWANKNIASRKPSLPPVESILFAMEMLDNSFDITRLLETVTHVLGKLKDIELELKNRVPTTEIPNSALPLPSITFFCIGILRKYHSCLLIKPESEIRTVFHCLRGIVASVGHPSDCTSAERCILAYMYDLYQSCLPLRATSENFHDPSAKIKKAFLGKCSASSIPHIWNREHESVVSLVLKNPQVLPPLEFMRKLTDPSCQHVFVVKTIEKVCSSQDPDKINEIACSCAEVTTRCTGFGAEWWAAIIALTFAHDTAKSVGYQILLEKIDVSDVRNHAKLAIFICILVARHCLRMEDYSGHIAIWSFMVLNSDLTDGGRLAVHLMFRLLRGCHAERENATDLFAKCVVDSFRLEGPEVDKAGTPGTKNKSRAGVKYELDPGQHLYYMAPFISKLSVPVQRQVLHYATDCIKIQPWSPKSKDREKVAKSNLLLAHAPFVSMVLICLDASGSGDQEDQRSVVLERLFNQLTELSKEGSNFAAAIDFKSRSPNLYPSSPPTLSSVRSFKKRAPRAVKAIKNFAEVQMKTEDVGVDTKNENNVHKLYTLVTWAPVDEFKGLQTQNADNEE